MLKKENLELWTSMLETAQMNLMKKGLPRDPAVDEQLEIWRKEIEKYDIVTRIANRSQPGA